MLINNWSIQIRLADQYKAPEQGVAVIVGETDEGYITTSNIMKLDIENSKVETKNSVYDLGNIDQQFEFYMKSNGYKIEDYFKE